MKTAFVTGFTGQDGTFLTELLLKKGYRVIALVRRVSSEPPHRIRGKFDFAKDIEAGNLILETGDLLSRSSLDEIIYKYQPDEVYNLAAQSHVAVSFHLPEFTIEADFMGVVNLIGALESCHGGEWKMYQASTSEMFGDQKDSMDEQTAFRPNSPYAIAKAAAHYFCQYKRAQGRFISCGILFNHESEIRGGDFVTQKIAYSVARLPDEIIQPQGPQLELVKLELGNLDSVRDWGYAGDYVKAMWAMLQQDKPDDFVVGTGVTRSVREFVEAAISARSLTIEWRHEGKHSEGYIQDKLFVTVSDKYWRPVDVRYLKGDATKAKDVLGWQPETGFYELVDIMVQAQLEKLS